MRSTSTVLAFLLFSGAASTVQAATLVSENLAGVVSGSNVTDTLGLFGPAGGNLAGKAITIHMQYVPSFFNGPFSCRSASSCSGNTSQNSPNTPGAVLLSVTINGKQLVYSSTQIGEVLFGKNSNNIFNIYADTTDFGFGLNGLRVSTTFRGPVTFGSTLSPSNNPVFNVDEDNVEFFTPSDEVSAETLGFKVTSATE